MYKLVAVSILQRESQVLIHLLDACNVRYSEVTKRHSNVHKTPAVLHRKSSRGQRSSEPPCSPDWFVFPRSCFPDAFFYFGR